MPTTYIWISIVCVGLVLSLFLGCNPATYKADADREVACIIGQKSIGTQGMPTTFNIERYQDSFRSEQVETATRVLTITNSLEIACQNSREYQTRMESLFSEALSLSMERHRFDPIYFGQGNYRIENDDFRKSMSSFFTFGFNKMLETGADLSVEMSTNLFRVISGGDASELATSALRASVVQPLMRGYGRMVTLENLTQAERDMVYAIRDFVRFRKTFTVGITHSYLALLGQVDQIRNAENNVISLQNQRDIVVNRVLAGMSTAIEADQAEQQLLVAQDSYIRTLANYERALDLYKLELGIPVKMVIQPQKTDLDKLTARGVTKANYEEPKAIGYALANRLDLRNTKDRVEDYQRKIPVSADLLKPGFDLLLEYGADSDGRTELFDFADGDKNYSAGVDLDLPLDRKAERNIYRQAFINLARAQRDYEESQDRITYEVRNEIRSHNLAVERHGIQVNSLKLAEVRVERDSLLLQAGRAITRDVLESQSALLDAQNAVTSALIDYYNSRLDLLLAMELLQVDDHGMWKEGTLRNDEWEYADQ